MNPHIWRCCCTWISPPWETFTENFSYATMYKVLPQQTNWNFRSKCCHLKRTEMIKHGRWRPHETASSSSSTKAHAGAVVRKISQGANPRGIHPRSESVNSDLPRLLPAALGNDNRSNTQLLLLCQTDDRFYEEK